MDRRNWRFVWRDRSGTAAVEFAIVAPVMLALLFGIFLYSLVLCTYSALQQVAAEAARAAIPGLSAAQQSQYATAAVSSALSNYGFIDANKVVVTTRFHRFHFSGFIVLRFWQFRSERPDIELHRRPGRNYAQRHRPTERFLSEDGTMRRFVSDQSGGVAVMFAASTVVLLLSAALSVDIGTFYLQKRALQGATDLAAVAAARNTGAALNAARQNLVHNGFSASAVQSVSFGVYTADATLSPSARFAPAASGNAVQVFTKIEAPFYFATILNLMSAAPPSDSVAITATAAAALAPQAAFAVGSGLASLDGGVENAVLGGLLGANVSLSAMDYQSLASAKIDLFAFSNALATQASVTGVTYNDLANAEVAAPQALQALAAAAQASSGVPLAVADDISALAALAPNTKIAVGSLISFGAYGALGLNTPAPITASADALDLASAIAALANGAQQVQVALNVNVAPIASATLALSIGEPPVGSGFVSIGSTGASAHTVQTRALVTFKIMQPGSSALIQLPIYLEIASGVATLAGASCPADPTQATVTLAVTPGVASAWIGTVSAAAMADFSQEPTPSPAPILSAPGLGAVLASAHAAITNLAPTDQVYTQSDIASAVRKTTSTTDFVASLVQSLFGSLQLSVQAGPIYVSAPSALDASVGATLARAATPIDQTLDAVMQALGVSAGNAYTWVTGLNCGSAKLVL